MKQKIVFATHNAGKIAELNQLLQQSDFEMVSSAALNIPDIEETGLTFIENALLKARHAATISQLPAIADDSGLVVPALHGAPGIYSARYAGYPQNSAKNIEKLLAELQHQSDRQAWFHCSLVFLRYPEDSAPIIAEGRWHGSILFEPKGNAGFGYDPIFFDLSMQRSAAELSPAEKNRLSHRGQAVRQLITLLSKQIFIKEI